MSNPYRKNISAALAATIEQMTAINPEEQLQLYDELALMRHAAGNAVGMYNKAVEAHEAETDPTKKKILAELVLQCGLVMRDHLNEVIRTAETAARINAAAKDKISLHQLHYFIEQVTRCAYVAFEGDEQRALTYERHLKEYIKLPRLGVEGTDLTPDMDVTAMDATIPKEP
jgi:hypothetical protein